MGEVDDLHQPAQADVANWFPSVVRPDPQEPDLRRADYTYHANGLVQRVDHLNGASIWYEYDGANRVTRIEHENGGPLFQLVIEYAYDDRDLPIQVTESGEWIDTKTSYFDYDNRGRLISEFRVATSPADEYDLDYEYDQGGNRTRKVDHANDREIVYHYDIEDPEEYGSENNRLMYCETFDTSGPSPVLLSTTRYYYGESSVHSACGNVTRVVSNQADSDVYNSTRLIYASNGSAVAYVTGESWEWDGVSDPTDYDITYAREFRYDGARARYLVRALDPVALLLTPPQLNPVENGDTWSDYDGDIVYGDFTADEAMETITNIRSYEPGIGRVPDPLTAPVAEYYHGDLIGSTRMMSDGGGYPITGSEAAYTAFGELVPGSAAHRFGYAGAYGYQAPSSDAPGDPYATEFPFLHVGHRYYDAATGRFLQRDPIGMAGGLNVYVYVRNDPLCDIDPNGLIPIGGYPPPYPYPLPEPESLEEEIFREELKAWGAAVCIGALSTIPGLNIGIPIATLIGVSGAGMYAIWPIR